ncbi:MAG: hypothetical protein ABL996_24850 [Micropepsaceae bacterium]
MERAQEHSLRTPGGRMNMAGDVLGLAKDFADLYKTYDSTRLGIERERLKAEIREQLAPNQQVRIVIDPKTNAVLEIARPGAGYLREPGEKDENGAMVEKLDYFQLEGDDKGICGAKVHADTTLFTVPDEDGKRRRIRLFEDNGPIEKDREPDADDRESRGHKNGLT